jgi:hypothetical protein
MRLSIALSKTNYLHLDGVEIYIASCLHWAGLFNGFSVGGLIFECFFSELYRIALGNRFEN